MRSFHPFHLMVAFSAVVSATGCEFILGLDKIDFHADTGGAGGTGGTITMEPSCIPSELAEPIADTCEGVFVSSSLGDDNAVDAGTKATPFQTLSKALAAAKGKPLYVCAESFTEAIVLTEDAMIHGGLDCTNAWAYVGATTKTTWTAGMNEAPLRVSIGARATLEDVALQAEDATQEGSSSIGIVAEAGTQLTLTRCDVTAGNGAKGANGETASDMGTPGVVGDNGTGSCMNAVESGAFGGQLECNGVNVAGGFGGNGTPLAAGAPGSSGEPVGGTGTGGLGLSGEPNCTAGTGHDGTHGGDGNAGLGAKETWGTLDTGTYVGPPGDDGTPGLPGQGGGGGGGGRQCANGKAGPSGGGGGSGGCGGAGGKGGQGGGASIGILSFGAQLTFEAVRITTSVGGPGGDGGAGQAGGAGAIGGNPGAPEGGGAFACGGGKGGKGGNGGNGGGGRGGPSIGIAYTGPAPSLQGATMLPGQPGEGGMGNGGLSNGPLGYVTEAQGF